MDIGVEPYLIAGAVRGIISQRLVRCICPNCRKAYTPTEEEVALLGLPAGSNHRFYRGEGCSDCFQTGYRGRTAVFEILTMTPAIRRAIHRQNRKELHEAVQQFTFHPILENCAQLVCDGVTTLDEVLRILGRNVE